MRQVFASVLIAVMCLTGAASAQQADDDVVWIQIEAHPGLEQARGQARDYAAELADVAGFGLGGNWYGILLGPYSRADAERLLRVYRSERRIPFDSFLVAQTPPGEQFWPQDARARTVQPLPTAPAAQEPATIAAVPVAEPEPVDESPAEARRSEQQLSDGQRRDLQIALQSAGFYNSGIDGAFGAGTRRSMADWQRARGYEATGILTTRQRQALMDEYNAPLISVGMQRILDPQAGIEMPMPTAEVRFSHYEPPFSHYQGAGDMGVRLILISQPGDRATLYGLYDILQTLDVIPLQGPRERDGDSFVIEGRGARFVSHAEARLEDGHVKGFILVWPPGDDERRDRVLARMQAGFTRTGDVLDPAAGADTAQDIDLVSGLRLRKPRLSRSGFFVDETGHVVTTAEAATGCARITLDTGTEAKALAVDDDAGIAILRPERQLAPMAVARLREGSPRLQSEVTLAGFSYEGALGAPSLSFGTLADVRGLNGETGLARLALSAQPGDAGGPVLDAGGGVLGMLLPQGSGNRQLPQGVGFAADAAAIRTVLDRAGVRAATETGAVSLSSPVLNRLARDMTVLVSCWD